MKNENSERIPLTIADWDENEDTITIYFQERGYSSMELTELEAGEFVYSVVGPLGKHITIDNVGTIMLGGGCYGIGAIYPIAKAAKESGNKIIVILEARNKNLFHANSEYRIFRHSTVFLDRKRGALV